MNVRKAWVFFACIGLFYASEIRAQFTVEYFGNMGVAIVHKDSAIFVDAFHDYYKDAYLPTFAAKYDDVLHRRSGFRTVVASLVSHYHDDHMDAAMLRGVMDAHPGMLMISGRQVNEKIGCKSRQCRQLINVDSTRETTINPALTITSLKTWHVNYALALRFAKTDNYFHLVDWNGRRFLHLGDTEIIERNFRLVERWKGRIDILLAPSWVLTDPEGVKLIDKFIQPKKIVILHVSPGTDKAEINSGLPAEIFSRKGDVLQIR